MKLSELFEEKEDNIVLRDVNPGNSAREFGEITSKKLYMDFLQTDYLVALQEMQDYIRAWVNVAKEHSYPVKHAITSLDLISKMVNKISKTTAQQEAIAPKNLSIISTKIKKFNNSFLRLAIKKAESLGAKSTVIFHKKLAQALKNAYGEIDANIEKVDFDTKVSSKDMGYSDDRIAKIN